MRHARKRRRTLVAVAGFVAAIAITFGIVLSRQVYGPGSKPTTEMALDLRPFAPSRDDQTAAAPPTPLLPRENVAVSAELPLGSETGKYEIRLMDDQLRVVQQTTGEAALQNHEVRLSVRLDLRKLAPGGYRLWIRREDRSWRDYPLEIR